MTLNKDLRKVMIQKGKEANLVHYSSSLSCIDFIAHLYNHIMTSEDTFILSKGHGALALYPVLEKHGFHPKWQMHPDYDPANGIMATTGSLGHGLPIAVGYALAKKIKNSKGRTYVLLGDGESIEGTNWEALSLAQRLGVNLTIAIDNNNHQIGGSAYNISGIDSAILNERLHAFGCKTAILNGHEERDLQRVSNMNEGLYGLVLKTIPGKGVSYLEKNQPHSFDWSKNPQEYIKALEELSI
jgi:transketolase